MTDIAQAHSNKALIQRGFTELAAGNFAVFDELIHDDYVEHSPGSPSGKTAFIENISRSPLSKARLEPARIIADGEYVVAHFRMIPANSDPECAVVDIWRIADGKVAEHWDVVQPVPELGRIPNGMF